MTKNILSQSQIIDFLIEHFNLESDSELARFLETNRQNVSQFRRVDQLTINTKIMSILIDELKRC